MSRPRLTRSVGDTLTTISALRRLCLTLPHAPTPDEARRIERFERLHQAAAPLGQEDIDALRTGLRRCWRSRDAGTLLDMAARIPAEFLDRDRWLQSFMVAAQSLSARQERSGSAARD